MNNLVENWRIRKTLLNPNENASRCSSCGKVMFYPRPVCLECARRKESKRSKKKISAAAVGLTVNDSGDLVLFPVLAEDFGKQERLIFGSNAQSALRTILSEITPAMWGLISGRVEEGESPEQALRREAEEETWLSDLEIVGELGQVLVEQCRIEDSQLKECLLIGQILLVVLSEQDLVHLAQTGIEVLILSIDEIYDQLGYDHQEWMKTTRVFVWAVVQQYLKTLA